MIQRNQTIDMAKAIGILLVIWGHSSQFLFKEIYSFHMPLFFLLSGIFHTYDKNLLSIVKDKVFKILWPYAVFFVGSYIFYAVWVSTFQGISKFNFLKISDLFILGNSVNAPLWFLVAIFWIALLYHAICRLPILGQWLCVVVAYVAVYWMTSEKISLPFFGLRVLDGLLYYHIGFQLRRWFQAYDQYAMDNWKLILSWGVLTGLFVGLSMLAISNLLMQLLLALLGSAWVLLFAKILPKHRWMLLIGTLTLPLMCIHLPLYELARPAGKVFAQKGTLFYDTIVFGVVFGISMLLSMLVSRRMPWLLGFKTT